MISDHHKLIQSIAGDDGELVLEFFASFSRFECALKRARFVKEGPYGCAIPDWNKFADKHEGRFVGIADQDFEKARSYLLAAPPQEQKVDAGVSMGWRWMPNHPQGTESDERHLLRLVRDVRNNLFHGGKYPTGDVREEDLRNRKLLEACLTILDNCRSLDPDVGGFFRTA